MAKALHNVALFVALLSATFLVGVHSSSVQEANLPARIAQVATSGISCSGNFTPTTTFMYSGLCTNFSDTSCWTPHFPTASDIALIPTGVSAVYGNPSNLGLFSLLSLNTLIISQGATLTMPSQALQVTNCFVVHGLLNLTASPVGQNYSAPTASTPYLADPAQPENTDCLLVSVGFTPRICGPGKLLVSSTGSVVLANYYSSLFIETDIAAGGQFLALTNSFIWGKVTNNGTFNASGFIYMHGYLFNHGTATLDAVAFDKWATSFVESPPLLIENYGSLTFFNSIHATIATYSGSAGVYKAALLNYKNLYFAITEKGSAVASTDFDLFNFGLVKWYDTTNQYWQGNWGGSGNYVNHGEFLADSVAVYLSTYHGVGGRLVHTNYGSYSFGSGSLNPRTVKLCTMQESMQKSLKNVQRAEKRPNMNSVVQRDGCWWYGDFCYHTPYIFSPPLLKTEQLPPRNVMTHHSIAVQLSKMINSVAVPSPCTQRYSFSEKSVIRGDGTGSVVTTMPVFIEDSLTVRLGGKWYALTENGVPPVWGGGVVRVANGGEMYLGLDADFNHDGKLIVERGGHLSIPKHAKVTVSNHTISIQAGGIFHVDGKLSTNVLSERIRNCGELRGVGRILKSKEDDLQC